jgi:DNA-binding PadR family transcriptional regulator
MAPYKDLTALTVLAFLSEQPRHPYDMQRLIRERHKDFASGNPRALYHAVERLLKQGLIEPLETNREGRRPERTIFQITEHGRDELDTWLHDLLENPEPEHSAFAAALSLMSCLDHATALNGLHGRTVALHSTIAALDAGMRALTNDVKLPRLVMIELEYARNQKSAELEFIRALIDDMTCGRLTWSRESLHELFLAHLTIRPSSAEIRSTDVPSN